MFYFSSLLSKTGLIPQSEHHYLLPANTTKSIPRIHSICFYRKIKVYMTA